MIVAYSGWCWFTGHLWWASMPTHAWAWLNRMQWQSQIVCHASRWCPKWLLGSPHLGERPINHDSSAPEGLHRLDAWTLFPSTLNRPSLDTNLFDRCQGRRTGSSCSWADLLRAGKLPVPVSPGDGTNEGTGTRGLSEPSTIIVLFCLFVLSPSTNHSSPDQWWWLTTINHYHYWLIMDPNA